MTHTLEEFALELDNRLLGNWRRIDYKLGKEKTQVIDWENTNTLAVFFGDSLTRNRKVMDLYYEDNGGTLRITKVRIVKGKEEVYQDYSSLLGLEIIKLKGG